MVLVAGTIFCDAASSPVFRFLSKRGKLLLLISSRSRCPLRKTLLVDHKSTVNLIALPRLQRGSPLLRITISSSDDSLSQVLRESIGPDIDQFGGEIGIDGGGTGE